MRFTPDRRKLLERMLARKTAAPGAGAIPRRAGVGRAPLTLAQEALWFVDQLEPQRALHNVPCAVRLSGPLDSAALEWALNEIVRRHAALRTVFGESDGRPYQIAVPHRHQPLHVVDLRGEESPEDQARRRATEEAHRPFDLEQGPLFRVFLMRLADEEQVLVLNFHHLVTDGWSMGLFTRELDRLYQSRRRGATAALDEPAIEMGDVALWQRERMQGGTLETHLAYWRRVVGRGLPVLALPTDHPRPAVASFRGQHQPIELSASLSHGLRQLSRRHGATPFMTLMAAFVILLRHRTGEDDVVIGSAIAQRNHPQLERLIGFLVNMLVLRTDLSGNPDFTELLRRVRETTLGACANQDLPLTTLVKEIQPERDLSRAPLFQVEFSLLTPDVNPAVYGYGLGTGVTQTVELLGLSATPIPVHYDNARYDIAVFLWDLPEGIRGAIEYSTDLFRPATVARLVEDFRALLRFVAARPYATLDELSGRLDAAAEQQAAEEASRYEQSMLGSLRSIRGSRISPPTGRKR